MKINFSSPWRRSKHNKQSTVLCSKCGKPMSKDFANQQIENKRPNAPICIPCILGKPRRVLPDLLEDNTQITEE